MESPLNCRSRYYWKISDISVGVRPLMLPLSGTLPRRQRPILAKRLWSFSNPASTTERLMQSFKIAVFRPLRPTLQVWRYRKRSNPPMTLSTFRFTFLPSLRVPVNVITHSRYFMGKTRMRLSQSFVFDRQRGDHRAYRKKGCERSVVIPASREVPVFIIQNNMRTAGMNREEYFAFLEDC